ncbi:MAG: SDR family NAD(P)-dependent oxidoreductase [Anaerolineales bacterium]|jgi:NAD(P)-dependent dehydrogenase (short-subunit alcohol dehydrogenase family)
MPNIVITGSTRGIGLGLARGFLERGGRVMVSGRHEETTSAAQDSLAREFGADRVFGFPCNVRIPQEVDRLWSRAQEALGAIDIWINNAGFANDPMPIWDLDPAQAHAAIETNLMGAVYGSQTAARGMLAQGKGAIYNMEGMGGDGRMQAGLAIYGTSKYAVHYFTLALAKELKGTGVIAASLRPGMVATDMIIEPYRGKPEEWQRVKPIFNIIAERLEVVTPWLVDQILTNNTSDKVISFSSNWKLMLRFLTSRFRKRDLFADVDISKPGEGEAGT